MATRGSEGDRHSPLADQFSKVEEPFREIGRSQMSHGTLPSAQCNESSLLLNQVLKTGMGLALIFGVLFGTSS